MAENNKLKATTKSYLRIHSCKVKKKKKLITFHYIDALGLDVRFGDILFEFFVWKFMDRAEGEINKSCKKINKTWDQYSQYLLNKGVQ